MHLETFELQMEPLSVKKIEDGLVFLYDVSLIVCLQKFNATENSSVLWVINNCFHDVRFVGNEMNVVLQNFSPKTKMVTYTKITAPFKTIKVYFLKYGNTPKNNIQRIISELHYLQTETLLYASKTRLPVAFYSLESAIVHQPATTNSLKGYLPAYNDGFTTQWLLLIADTSDDLTVDNLLIIVDNCPDSTMEDWKLYRIRNQVCLLPDDEINPQNVSPDILPKSAIVYKIQGDISELLDLFFVNRPADHVNLLKIDVIDDKPILSPIWRQVLQLVQDQQIDLTID